MEFGFFPNCLCIFNVRLIGQFRVPAVFYDINRFGLFFQGYVPPFNRFWLVSKTIDTEGCGSRQSCRIAAVLRRKGRKKSSQVKFPFFRCFYWRFSDIVLNSVDREGQKNIGVCVSAQRQSLLFQHLYLSCVISHFLPCHRRTAETPFLTAKSHILCFQATTQGTSGSPPVQDGFL